MHRTPSYHVFRALERYGFLILLLYFTDIFTPDFSPKLLLMDIDLSDGSPNRESSNSFKQLFIAGLFIGYGLLMLGRSGLWKFVLAEKKALLPIGLILAVCFASSVWSSHMLLSLKRSLFQGMLFFIVLSSVFYATRARTFARCIYLFLFAFLIMTAISLSTGNSFIAGSLAGWLPSKNNYGALCLFWIFMLSLYRQVKNNTRQTPKPSQIPQKTWLFDIIICFFLVLSASKTSLALALLFYIMQMNRHLGGRYMAGLTGIFLIGIFVLPLMANDIFGNQLNIALFMDSDSLTGRGFIWTLLYTEFQNYKQFILGAGYSTYFGTGDIPSALNIQYSYVQYLNQAHNGYLELALQFGVPIAVGILALLVIITQRMRTRTCRNICWIILLYNVTESAFLRDQHIMWATFLIAIAFDTAWQPLNRLVLYRKAPPRHLGFMATPFQIQKSKPDIHE